MHKVSFSLPFSVFVSCIAAFFSVRASDLTLDDVISRNTQAMGGAAAIENVRAVEISLHISDPGHSEVDAIYHAVRPGKMRIDIVANGKRVYMERFDGEKGWDSDDREEEREEAAAATAALRHGIELPGILFGLHEMRQRGHQLELKGRQIIDGIDYYVIHLRFSDGYETSLFMDPQTWRIDRRRDIRALHPDLDPTPTTIESRKSDWRRVDGVWYAFMDEAVNLKTGKVIETSKVTEIKINPTIAPVIFTKP